MRRDGHDLGAAGQLVLITHMPTHVGTITDIERVGRILAGSGALFVVDVAQTLGQMPLDLHRIGAMSPSPRGASSCAPPRGTGVAYVRAALAERLVPLTPPLAPSAALVGHR